MTLPITNVVSAEAPDSIISSHAAIAVMEKQIPFVVDLDGTLVKTDLLVESLVKLIRINPLYVFLLPFWLMKGKTALKCELAKRVSLDVELLPFNKPFLVWLRELHASGRPLILATASHSHLAGAVAEHLGIFAEVFGSGADVNLGGQRKRALLVKRFGRHGFDYAGNAHPDLHIWPDARRAIVVNPDRGIERKARACADVERVYVDRNTGIGLVARAIRVHQWLKNLLVFVPLLAAHAWSNGTALLHASLAFAAFSFGASAIYLVNDALDLDADRAHPRKKRRPMAAGDLTLTHAAMLTIGLLAASLALAAMVSFNFVGMLFVYIATTLAYSLWLKRYVLVDVMVLGALYTLRVIAGAVAVAIMPSFWLIAFSMFLFTSLALVKRCAELKSLELENKLAAKGRDYRVADFQQLSSLGASTGNAAIVVLAFYINSPDVSAHYRHPAVLWLLCPLLLYWIARMWIKAGRGEMHDDPIVYSVKDRASQVIGIMTVLLVCAAIWL